MRRKTSHLTGISPGISSILQMFGIVSGLPEQVYTWWSGSAAFGFHFHTPSRNEFPADPVQTLMAPEIVSQVETVRMKSGIGVGFFFFVRC